MANNKGREKVDQPAGNTLTGIDRLLAEMVGETIHDDEFTIAMVAERSPDINPDVIRHRLDRLVNKGVCTKRIITEKGRQTKAYRYV